MIIMIRWAGGYLRVSAEGRRCQGPEDQLAVLSTVSIYLSI